MNRVGVGPIAQSLRFKPGTWKSGQLCIRFFNVPLCIEHHKVLVSLSPGQVARDLSVSPTRVLRRGAMNVPSQRWRRYRETDDTEDDASVATRVKATLVMGMRLAPLTESSSRRAISTAVVMSSCEAMSSSQSPWAVAS